jgi:hypothetical protein
MRPSYYENSYMKLGRSIGSINFEEMAELSLELRLLRAQDNAANSVAIYNAQRGDCVSFQSASAYARLRYAFESGLFPQE